LVTCGSKGIGLAVARRFAAAGNDLILVARRPEPLKEAADRIRSEFKVEAIAVPLDLSSPQAIPVIEAALSANRAYADVLINSAGMGLAGPFHEQAPEAIMQLVDLNVRALTALTQHFLAGMLVRGRGGILNLASLGSYTPGPNQGVYYASKAYVLSLSESIAAETAGLGVRITALAPGPVNTGFHARMGSEQAAGIIHRREIAAADDPKAERERLGRSYAREHLTAVAAVADGHVDEIISPGETREHIAKALGSMETATRTIRPAGNLPL
jgi:hypothetical protein